MGLTGRERILKTVAGKPVDQIPVAPFIHLNFLREYFGQDNPDAVELTIRAYDDFGFDIIHRNCTPAYDDLALEDGKWICIVETRQANGKDLDRHYQIATPEGELTQTFSLRWTSPYDFEYAPTKYLIENERDFELLRKYQPPVGRIDTEPIARARRAVGDRGIVAPWIQGVFNHVAYYYRPLDQLALDPLLRPEFYRQVMEYFLERNICIAMQMVEAGADMLSVGINVASGKLFDPRFVRDHVIPYERLLNHAITSHSCGVINHNCGCARSLLPLYKDIGATIYESLTPPPHGDTALSMAVSELGPHMTLMGGFDQIDILRNSTPNQINDLVGGMIDSTRGRCRYILGTTDYINENTPLENIHAFAQAGRRYGEMS